MINDYSVIDLFSGIGGLTHGFYLEGFTIDAGIDFDISCKYPYEVNNKSQFIQADLSILRANQINELFTSKNRILVGCAPCQAFSQYSKKNKNDKWKLV